MGSMPKSLDLNMQFAGIPGTSLEVSRIGIGTWAIGDRPRTNDPVGPEFMAPPSRPDNARIKKEPTR